jgi:hypothetical protein
VTLAVNHPQATLPHSESNLGSVETKPGGAQDSNPYVAFCDDDIRWQAGALSQAADLLDAHPALASVAAVPGWNHDRCRTALYPTASAVQEPHVPKRDYVPFHAITFT